MEVQPSLGLHLGVQLFTTIFVDRWPAKCLHTLEEWVVGCLEETSSDPDEAAQDERLFDQGEASTTFEGVHLAKIIRSQLDAVAKVVNKPQPCSGDSSGQKPVMKRTGKECCSEKSSAEPTLLSTEDFPSLPIPVMSPDAVQQLRQSARDATLDLASRLEDRLRVWLPASPYLSAGEWEAQCTDCCRILLLAEALTGLVPKHVEASLVERWAELLQEVGRRFLSDGQGSSCSLVAEPAEKIRLWCDAITMDARSELH